MNTALQAGLNTSLDMIQRTVVQSLFVATAAATLCVAFAAPQAHAAGSVDVQWLKPDTYTDAGRSSLDRERVMKSLGDHLQKLGKQLPDGQLLKLDITDLNLAGEIEPFRWHDLRVLRGRADWPQMSLHYSLSADGRTLKSGDAQLQDMGYLFSNPTSLRQEDLGYEKRMVDRWFKAEFGGR